MVSDIELTEQDYAGTTTTSVSPDSIFTFGVIGGIGIGYNIGSGAVVLDIRGFGNTGLKYDGSGGRKHSETRYALPLLLLGYEYHFK
jgi:hypothetical protein